MTMNIKTQLKRRQSGVALVELMIAMLLGLVLMGGVLQMFSSSRQTHRVHEATARMQEGGRMALEVIARDIRMAGFWGCASDVTEVVNNLDTGGTGFVDFGAGGIAGFEGTSNASDTLIVRGGFNSGLGIQPPYGPQPSADITVSVGNGLQQSDIVFISDCSSADIFQVSNADPDASGTLVHNTSSATEPGNANVSNPGCAGASAHCLSKVYGADASVFSLREISYSIATGSEGQPALFRNGAEYLDGVEDLQVLYGEDTDLDGVANYFVAANQVANMGSVVSIRFSVVMRSQDDNLTGGINQNYTVLGSARTAPDERLRQTYTSTVNMRNRM